MRELKFRAWDKENQDMVYHPTLYFDQKTGKLDTVQHDEWRGDSEPEDWTPAVDGIADAGEIVLMQFTGLTDRHGKEIWEGDILLTDEADWKAIVTWASESGMFYLTDNTGGFSSFCNWNKCKVLGNIYENPDLLNPQEAKEGG